MKLGEIISRDDFARIYYRQMSSRTGRGSAIRSQLQYLRRNLSPIEKLFDAVGCPPFPLEYRLQRQYWIIQLLYHHQEEMYQKKERRCDDRIVSVSQPHVRPIVRGKAGKSTEFGVKISVI